MDQNKEQIIKEEANSTSFSRFIKFLPFILFILFAGLPIFRLIKATSSNVVGVASIISSFQAIMNDPIVKDLGNIDGKSLDACSIEEIDNHFTEVFNNLTEQGFTVVENEEEHWLHIYSKEKDYDLLCKGFSRTEDSMVKIELTKNGKHFEIADTGYEERNNE